jgi:hypothetical protein
MPICNSTTLDQLLSIRDASPVEAYVVQHVNTCAACSRELDRLRETQSLLNAMPILAAPAQLFSLQSEPRDKQPVHASKRIGFIGFAAAASVIALATLIAFTRLSHREDTTLPISVATSYALTDNLDFDDRPGIASLVVQSQDLESRLHRLPSRPIVERASTTTVIDSLQDSIQLVDYQLSAGQDSGLSDRQTAQLWKDRIQLMDSLVKVRYAEAQRFAVLQYQ